MAVKGVILAAGDGDRLAPLTLDRPKPLVPVLGKPMIEYTLESFARAGVEDVTIVVGYLSHKLQKHVGDGRRFGLQVQFVYNPDYEKGNALSLYAAREAVGDSPFILAMSDHLVSQALVQRALERGGNACSLCVDYKPLPLIVDEATKVLVDAEGRIRSIGKEISPWNGVDTGVFLLTPEVFEAIERVMDEKGDCELSDAMTWLINQGSGLIACDVTGSFWMDVDTLQDLKLAERLLKKEVHDGCHVVRRSRIQGAEQEVLKASRPVARPHPGHTQPGDFPEPPDRAWSWTGLWSG